MTRRQLLSHVRHLLAKRGLTPDGDVKEILSHQRRFFRTRCVDAKGNEFTFKVYLLRVPTIRHDFQHEIAFYHYAARAHLVEFPRWVAGDRNREHPWILYHYIPGALFTSHLKRNGRHLAPRLITALAQALTRYGQLHIPTATRRLLHLQAHRASDFGKRFTLYTRGKNRRTILQYLTETELEAAARIIAFHKTEKRLPRDLGVSHGDLSTNNLIVNADHFSILDWEHVQIASPAYDVAELWVKEFSRAPWRNRLALRVAGLHPHPESFGTLFSIEVLLFCLRDLLLHDRILHRLHHEKNRAVIRKLLQYYARTFRAALRGFPSLLKS